MGALQRRLREVLTRLAWAAAPYAFFSTNGILYRALDCRGKTVLDLGCGSGERALRIIKKGGASQTIGVDIFEPSLKAAKALDVYSDLLLADVRWLPFKERSFDVVLACELVEHLEKQDGWKLLNAVELIARQQVIVTTPAGFYRQELTLDGNPFARHVSGYSHQEFRAKGYKVRSVGLRWLAEWLGHRSRRSLWCSVCGWLLSLLPLAYFVPDIGGNLVCVKRLNYQGRGEGHEIS